MSWPALRCDRRIGVEHTFSDPRLAQVVAPGAAAGVEWPVDPSRELSARLVAVIHKEVRVEIRVGDHEVVEVPIGLTVP
jgi:hypothetical protein